MELPGRETEATGEGGWSVRVGTPQDEVQRLYGVNI